MIQIEAKFIRCFRPLTILGGTVITPRYAILL
jgi:hypothetical protein